MGEEEKTARFELRLPVSLRQRLQERAREHNRSLNSEIVGALNVALVAEQMMANAEQKMADMDQELEARFKASRARLEKIQGEMQRIEEWMPVHLPPETSSVIARAE
jgi:plasmid stability protein